MNAFRKTFESLEQRQMMTAVKGDDLGSPLASDGTKANSNDIVVSFDGNLKSVDVTKIRLFGYHNDTINGGQTKVTIPIVSGSVSGKTLTLRTGFQVRKGAQITFNSGAVTDANNNNVEGSFRLRKGLNRDRFTLALRSFKPNDPTYFSRSVISGGKADVVANQSQSESSVTSALTAFLAKKVKDKVITTKQRDNALALYNSSTSKAIAAPAVLRAAVVSLVGTVAEPAMNALLGSANSTGKAPSIIQFNTSDISSGAKDAETTYSASGRLRVTFASDYAGESFVALSGRMAREIMHDDSSGNHIDKQNEEVVANMVESVVYAQQIVEDFTYATRGTTYTLYQNYHLYTLINSGDQQFPRVGTGAAPLVGSNPVVNPGFTGNGDYAFANSKSFDATVRSKYDGRISNDGDTSMNSLQATILNNITGNSYSSKTLYSASLIKDIDLTQDTLSDAYVMRVARVLQVTV